MKIERMMSASDLVMDLLLFVLEAQVFHLRDSSLGIFSV